MNKIFIIIMILTISLFAKNSKLTGYYAKNKEVKSFINYMIRKHNFKRSYLIDVFSRASKPKKHHHKKRKLRKYSQGIARGKRGWLKNSGYTKFEKSYLAEDRVRQGVRFVQRYKTLFDRIEKKLKVDRYIVTAIIGIESYYGEIKGHWDTFNTLAYFTFRDKRRAKLFRYELENYLLLCYRQKLKALSLKGSKYGALGIGQLLPHNYIQYGVSFDKNKRIEPFSKPDSIATVANFIHKKGWKYKGEVAIRASYDGLRFNDLKTNTKKYYHLDDLYFRDILPRKKVKTKRFRLVKLQRAEYDELWLTFKNFDVLKRYNNSTYYAMAVFHLAQEIKKRVTR